MAVFITNQVISDPSGGAMFVADPKKPGGCWGGADLCLCLRTRPGAFIIMPHQQLSSIPEQATAVLLLALTSAVGGHVLAHASTVRLSVRKGKAEQRLMKVGARALSANGCHSVCKAAEAIL